MLLQLELQGKIGKIVEVISGCEGKYLSGIKWCLVSASIVFDKEGFAISGGKLLYVLAYQQLRDHWIFKIGLDSIGWLGKHQLVNTGVLVVLLCSDLLRMYVTEWVPNNKLIQMQKVTE